MNHWPSQWFSIYKKTRNSLFQVFFGGDKRDRTADLLNAIQALSQLSYTPIFTSRFSHISCRTNIILADNIIFVNTFFLFFGNFFAPEAVMLREQFFIE